MPAHVELLAAHGTRGAEDATRALRDRRSRGALPASSCRCSACTCSAIRLWPTPLRRSLLRRPLARRAPRRGDLGAAVGGGLRRRGRDGDRGRRGRRRPRGAGRDGGPFTGVNHVCVVTRDLDRAVGRGSDGTASGPGHSGRKDDVEHVGRGRRRQAESFAFRVGPLQRSPRGSRLELIEPLDDRGPYAESLARHDGARPRASRSGWTSRTTTDARERLDGLGLDGPARCARSTARRTSSSDGVGDVRSTRWTSSASCSRSADVPAGFEMPEPELWSTRARPRRGGNPMTPRPVGRARPGPRAFTLDPGEERRYRERTPRSLELLERTKPADPDRPRRRHVVPAALPGAARARQGLPDLGRRRQPSTSTSGSATG